MTALESDNQLLCNSFLKWSSWAGLIVRVDKCRVFGMKKSKAESIQYQSLRHNQPRKSSTNQKWLQLYLFKKGLQFQHELRSRKKKFNENHSLLYQQNRYFTNSSLIQNRDILKIHLLENQMGFINL